MFVCLSAKLGTMLHVCMGKEKQTETEIDGMSFFAYCHFVSNIVQRNSNFQFTNIRPDSPSLLQLDDSLQEFAT